MGASAAPSPDPAWLPSTPQAIGAARAELRAACAALSARGLVAPAKWAGEQLMGLPPPTDAEPPPPQQPVIDAHPLDARSADALALAGALFAGREYRRAAHVLAGAHGPAGAFLSAYALYLAGEASRAAGRFERGAAVAAAAGATAAAGAPAAGAPPTAAAAADPGNAELGAVLARLGESARASGCAHPAPDPATWDPFWLYLAGLVAADQGREREARRLLAAAVRGFPCNWGAWAGLAFLDGRARAAAAAGEAGEAGPTPEDADAGGLPHHWAAHFYAAHVAVEAHDAPSALAALAPIGASFPRSEWVAAAAATAHYYARNFEEAQELFEDAHSRDPHRLDALDTYSNTLYVKDAGAELAALARSAALTDKFAAPTAIAAGNYFSLRGDHGRAIASFRRALALSPAPHTTGAPGAGGGAWTLLGHEWLELQNPAAAVDAYRRALDASPGDYRAWYGLGQAYELLHLPHHALWYYRRAAALRPGDARMWVAIGQCCEGGALADDGAAAAAYRRALRASADAAAAAGTAAPAWNEAAAEHGCLGRLARVYERLGDFDAAAAFHTAALKAADAAAGWSSEADGPPPPPTDPDAADALVYLGAAARDRGDWATAEAHARRLAECGSGGGGGGSGGAWHGGGGGSGGGGADGGHGASGVATPAAAGHALLAEIAALRAAGGAGGRAGAGSAARRRSSVGGGGGRRRPSLGGLSPGDGVASPRW